MRPFPHPETLIPLALGKLVEDVSRHPKTRMNNGVQRIGPVARPQTGISRHPKTPMNNGVQRTRPVARPRTGMRNAGHAAEDAPGDISSATAAGIKKPRTKPANALRAKRSS